MLNTVINLLLALYMILQPVSGILMSKYVLKEMAISGASGTLRTIHMTLVYWGFLLDYASVMVLVANIGFYIQSGLIRIQNRRKGR